MREWRVIWDNGTLFETRTLEIAKRWIGRHLDRIQYRDPGGEWTDWKNEEDPGNKK